MVAQEEGKAIIFAPSSFFAGIGRLPQFFSVHRSPLPERKFLVQQV